MKVAELAPAAYNPRDITDKALAGLGESLDRFGLVQPPVFNKRTGRLVGGHQRIKVLKKSGAAVVDVVVVDIDEIEEKALNITLNNPEISGTFTDGLQGLLAEINEHDHTWMESLNLEALFDMSDLTDPPAPTSNARQEDNEADDVLPAKPRKKFKAGQVKKVGRHTIACSDCVAYLRTIPPNSIDSIVTDPPYGIGFMGKEWDVAVPGEEWARECLRVLKPGGHIIAFAATRTVHRLAVAIEDAGFEIRDTISWLYWQGFPKSMDVSKAIDKMKHNLDQVYQVTAWIAKARDEAGITNKAIDDAFGFKGMAGHWTSKNSQPHVPPLDHVPMLLDVLGVEEPPEEIKKLLLELNADKGQPGADWFKREKVGTRQGVDMKLRAPAMSKEAQGAEGAPTTEYNITASASENSKKWEGWGTALKPAQEPAILARKPLDGTVANNVLTHGTGSINIDGCRIEPGDPSWPGPQREDLGGGGCDPTGKSAKRKDDASSYCTAPMEKEFVNPAGRWPANIFVCPKPAGTEKDAGLDEYGDLTGGEATDRKDGSKGLESPRAGAGRNGGGKNFHPTVKPVRLMRWLIRLVTPPGGVVVDTFLGSGTTMVAAEREGFECIGIEMAGEFAALSEARVLHSIDE